MTSCNWDQSEEAERDQYIGCYKGDRISLVLDDGLASSKNGSYVYRIYKKKIGMVLASNFSLRRNNNGDLAIAPSNYEKYYQIGDGFIMIADSSYIVNTLYRSSSGECGD